MTKIFISHSNKDSEFAMQLANSLTEVGIDVWSMEADIRVGKKWSAAVQEGLDTCEAMILVLSPDSMASNNVEDEWQYYLDKRKRVFPVRWKPADLHFQLSRLQYVDFYEKEFARAFNHLCIELKRSGITVNGFDGQMHVIESDDAGSYPRRTVINLSHFEVEQT